MMGIFKQLNRNVLALLLSLSLALVPFQGVLAGEAPAPVQVAVRVEGASSTILNVDLDVTSPEGDPQTALDALTQGLDGAGISYSITQTEWGPYIESINGEAAGNFGGWDGWIFAVNNETAPVGAGDYYLMEGDRLLFYYGMFPPETLIPSVTISPSKPQPGSDFTVLITSTYFDWGTMAEVNVLVEGALVIFNGQEYLTDAEGEAVLTASGEAGTYYLKASLDVPDSYPLMVRTEEIPVVVSETLSVDKSQLAAAIQEAEDLLAGAEAGDSPGQYPQQALDDLGQALSESMVVQADEKAAQSEVDAALAELNKAIKNFRGAVAREKAPGLLKAIEDTVAYYQSLTGLTSWWELVALRGAGVDLTRGDWPQKLPAWSSQSLPADSPVTTYAGFILGLMARGEHPEKAWGGRNIPMELAGKQLEDGSFGDGVNSTIWGIIALKATSFPFEEEKALAYLLAQQLVDGGYTFFGSNGDPDLTAMALVALRPYNNREGVKSAVEAALDFLEAIQLDSAGFSSWGNENANTIAAVLSGLIAVGEDILSERWVKNPTIYGALMSFQLENGSFSFISEPFASNAMATSQALLALGDLQNEEPAFFRLRGTTPETGGMGYPGLFLGLLGLGTALLVKRRKV